MKPYSYSPRAVAQSFEALKKKQLQQQQSQQASALATSSSVSSSSTNNVDGSFMVAAIQLSAEGDEKNTLEGFWKRAQTSIREAAAKGARLILLPELFIGPYFCQSQEACLMEFADAEDASFIIAEMQKLAKELQCCLPISFYERRNNALFNSLVMIDADGSNLGVYRKSHIPDGTGYQEKFYFSPGDTGFKVFKTSVGTVGVGICWDQWFPECARAMALQGADIILYPTAIGSEPQDPSLNSAEHWQRVMQGHSAANMVPVVASNRYGTEILLDEDGLERQRITFYGRSFITDATGAIIEEAKDMEGQSKVLVAKVTPRENRADRLAWGLFRDRRPELYGILLSKDGTTQS